MSQSLPQPPPRKLHRTEVDSFNPKTRLGRFTYKALLSLWEVIYPVGQAMTGELWQVIYPTIQDAIALAVLVRIPSFLFALVTGKNFTDFNACSAENPLGASYYSCIIIVASDFSIWILLAGRFIARFIIASYDLKKLFIKGGSDGF